MKLLRMLVPLAAMALVSGCYYDPGYSYVRGDAGGDAYYGTATVVQPAYDGGYYGYGGYPGYYYGPDIGLSIGSVYYRNTYYRHRYDDGRGYRGGYRGPAPGRWQGRPGDGHHPSGNWQGRPGDGYRPQNAGSRPPSRADGDNRGNRGHWQNSRNRDRTPRDR
jgi:hypothetical protein